MSNRDVLVPRVSTLTILPSHPSIPYGDTFSIVATKRGTEVVPLESNTIADAKMYYVRKGDLSHRRALLDIEAEDVFWWQNFWRILFAGVMTPLCVLMVRSEWPTDDEEDDGEDDEKKEKETKKDK